VTDIAAAVAECEPELELLSDRPLVLFGHCLGAYLAFELCGRLSARRLPVVGLVVSSQAAPHLELQSTAIRRDADLLQAVRAMGGTATEILEDAEARSLFLPVLRADFAVAESFTAREPVQLDVPIAAFAGRDDPVVASAEVAAWEEHTKQFSFHVREGGHFPSDDDWRRMADVVARQLAEPQAVATALGGRSS
jgi:surfactin synthase thioesterase subunit